MTDSRWESWLLGICQNGEVMHGNDLTGYMAAFRNVSQTLRNMRDLELPKPVSLLV